MQGDRLREVREVHGWSQRELAIICGFGNNMISRYENGSTDPSAKALQIMAGKLDVSVDYLLGLTNNPRGQRGDSDLSADEWAMVDAFRRGGWPHVLRLVTDRLVK